MAGEGRGRVFRTRGSALDGPAVCGSAALAAEPIGRGDAVERGAEDSGLARVPVGLRG